MERCKLQPSVPNRAKKRWAGEADYRCAVWHFRTSEMLDEQADHEVNRDRKQLPEFDVSCLAGAVDESQNPFLLLDDLLAISRRISNLQSCRQLSKSVTKQAVKLLPPATNSLPTSPRCRARTTGRRSSDASPPARARIWSHSRTVRVRRRRSHNVRWNRAARYLIELWSLQQVHI